MMTNAWNLDGKRTDKKAWAGENKAAGGFSASKGLDGKLKGEPRAAHKAQHATDVQDEMNLNYSEKQLCEVMRKKLAARGARGIQGLGRQFKIADDDNSKALSVDEFKNAIHDFRVGLNESDTARLFKIFDRDHSGSIDYEEFLRGVRGEMNEFRTSIAMLAFNIMDCDKSGVIDINDIRSKYNAKMHPDVKSGKKTEDEILFEFIDTFEKHHSDNVEDIKDGRVSKSEWKEYYNNVSMSIDTDEYFETMMNNAWKLKGNDKVKKGWGGQF
jgi:Ca2+-binding EF-hand superfamily protein